MLDACLLILFLSVISCEGGSSKKGVCIPPGTNFHCGDLSAFNNIRKVKISTFCLRYDALTCCLLYGCNAVSDMNIAQFQLVV